MKILIDTHIFIWYFQGSEKMKIDILCTLDDPENTLYLSIVSLWEISIKIGLGKLKLQVPFSELEAVVKRFNIETLPIMFADTNRYQYLPLHHRDPFDRMLIAQAMNHSLVVVSADAAFDAYPIQRIWK